MRLGHNAAVGRLGHNAAARRLGNRAVAAVEFALCAPMLVILFLGTLEILMLYRTEAKLNAFAGSIAQMVSLQEIAAVNASGVTQTHSPLPTGTTGTTPGLADLCAGAVYGLQPFPPSGMTLAVASVTQTVTAQPATQHTAATPALYDEWEVDLNSACATTGGQSIGSIAAKTLAVGNGSTTSMVQGLGDNVVIVRATLQYPGVIGLILSAAPTLTQTVIARWRYASATNVTNTLVTPAPSSTLEFSCTGTGCKSNYGI